MPSVLYQNAKHWADFFIEMQYEDTLENLIEKEREKERQDLQKKIILKLYTKKHLTANQIADVLDLELVGIHKFISKMPKT